MIPEKSDHIANRKRLGAKGGRPPLFDKEAYKRRNVIERCFETFKQWRAIATRYDKLAVTYRGGVVLRAITIWLKLSQTRALIGNLGFLRWLQLAIPYARSLYFARLSLRPRRSRMSRCRCRPGSGS